MAKKKYKLTMWETRTDYYDVEIEGDLENNEYDTIHEAWEEASCCGAYDSEYGDSGYEVEEVIELTMNGIEKDWE